MAIRKLSGLISARECASAPGFAKPSRARGAKREGLKYEKAFASALGSCARHGVWFEGRDRKGLFWAQPDVLMKVDGGIVIFECKYTWVPDAEEKLRKLYIPLVEAIYGGVVGGIVVCKKLTPETPRENILRSLKGAIFDSLHRITKTGRFAPILHWDSNWSLAEGALPWHPNPPSRSPELSVANPTPSAMVDAQRSSKPKVCPVEL